MAQKIKLPKGARVLDMRSGEGVILPSEIEVQVVPMLVFGFETADGKRIYAISPSPSPPRPNDPVPPTPLDPPLSPASIGIYDPFRLFRIPGRDRPDE